MTCGLWVGLGFGVGVGAGIRARVREWLTQKPCVLHSTVPLLPLDSWAGLGCRDDDRTCVAQVTAIVM